jgi:FkbH-like protein
MFEDSPLKISFDTKLMPFDGCDPQLAVVLINAARLGDPTPRLLAERWRGHLSKALFALPQFEDHQVSAGTAQAGASYRAAIELGLGEADLEKYIAQIRDEYGLDNSQIAVVGYAEGMTLALYYGLRQKESLCAVIGFSGDMAGFADIRSEISSRPPVLLVHGEKDDVVLPGTFLNNYSRLSEADVPVTACFRPGLDHQVDDLGADSAMFFLQGAHGARGIRQPKKKALTEDIAKSIKLVIWDLDDTLWQGTLDDADAIHLHESRVDAIRRLNASGIVSAICSKNDFETARKKLESLNLWDEFVFPRIAFVPKGAAIQALIADMQLKPKNCVFIDDNDINLAEAKAVLPDLHTIDAKSEDCDAFLARLVEAHAGVNKSRVEEYRSLENRVTESQSFDGSRESFLHTCDIHVAIASSSDLIDFAPRIEELINRTNQLNYLKTRVEPGSMINYVSEASLREGFALFAWDKFGYHGLVGFISAETETESIQHMAFSCRIMHMGIENVLLERAFQRFRNLQVPDSVPVKPQIPAWITVENFNGPGIRERIFAEEKSIAAGNRDIRIRFMANCQSGIFCHYAGLRDVAEIDSMPRVFMMPNVLNKSYLQQHFPPALVYYIGTDYYNIMWPPELVGILDKGLYEVCATEFCEYVKANGNRMLLITSPSGVEPSDFLVARGVTKERMAAMSSVWRKLAATYDCIDLMDVDGFLSPDLAADSTHFRVEASREIASRIADWYQALPSSLFEQPLALAG